MKPDLLALLTAACWGIGSYFQKKGLHQGNLSPQMGITLCTAAALVVLAVVSHLHWKTVPQAGTAPLLYMNVGGGIVTGSVGMLFFYSALKGAPLTRVIPIAFTVPLFGALMGFHFGGEPMTVKAIAGMLMTVGGIVLLTVG